MKIQCDYCDNTYEDTLPQCPYCEAPNPAHKQTKGAPKTIEELKQWYKDRNLPPYETTRFFIGENHKGPKAFGIYQDPSSGDFVVYKNKGDGTRAERYRGGDEQYAVNELYQKLKDEIVHQKAQNTNTGRSNTKPSKNSGMTSGKLSFIIFAICLIIYIIWDYADSRHNGYYNYNDTVYYNYDNNWYYYDNDYDSWVDTNSYDPGVNSITESYDDYYVSDDWNSDIDASDWDDTEYYDSFHSSSDSDYDSSSDSDWDWGSSDSWDSGGSDWDSDW